MQTWQRTATKPLRRDAVTFDDGLQCEILVLAHDISDPEGWRREAAGIGETQTHLVISWTTFVSWEKVDQRLKNLLVLKLNRRRGITGKRWRSTSTTCFPSTFPDYAGIFWKRGMKLPELPKLD